MPARLSRSPLGAPVSLGVHESQSRLWENLVGRSRPFCAWALPRLAAHCRAASTARRVDDVLPRRQRRPPQPDPRRGRRDDLQPPHRAALRARAGADGGGARRSTTCRARGTRACSGCSALDVPDDAQGVLQDVHWGAGLIGYFPTYTLGNLMAAQLWETLRAELPEIDAQLERGEFGPLQTWLRERIHVHGRKLPSPELLARVTGQELAVAPFLRYLREKLTDAGVLSSNSSLKNPTTRCSYSSGCSRIAWVCCASGRFQCSTGRGPASS